MSETLVVVGTVLAVLGALVFVYGITSNLDFVILAGGVIAALGVAITIFGFYLIAREFKAALKKIALKIGIE